MMVSLMGLKKKVVTRFWFLSLLSSIAMHTHCAKKKNGRIYFNKCEINTFKRLMSSDLCVTYINFGWRVKSISNVSLFLVAYCLARKISTTILSFAHIKTFMNYDFPMSNQAKFLMKNTIFNM